MRSMPDGPPPRPQPGLGSSQPDVLLPARPSRPWRRTVQRALVGSVAALAFVAVVLGVWLWQAWSSVPRFEDLDDGWGEVVPAAPSNDGGSSAGAVLPLRPRIGVDESQLPVDTVPEGLASGDGSAGAIESPPPTTEPIVLPDVPGRENVETYLVFSTGITDITHEQALAIGVNDPDQRGRDDLTDVIMVMTVGRDTGRTAVLSIPRDTWLLHRQSRINRVFGQFGPAALAGDVAELTGLEIDHVIRVNMMGFVQLTDELGGVEISVARPIRDAWTGLDLPAGQVRLDGPTALQYVRARHTEVLRDDEWVAEGTADFGRMQRQRSFLVAMMNAAWGLDAVTKLPGLLDTVQRNVVLDEDLGLTDIIDLAGHIRSGGGGLPGYQMPAEVGWVGPASVVFVDRVGARELVASVVATVTP